MKFGFFFASALMISLSAQAWAEETEDHNSSRSNEAAITSTDSTSPTLRKRPGRHKYDSDTAQAPERDDKAVVLEGDDPEGAE